jgi:hypothetical protein
MGWNRLEEAYRDRGLVLALGAGVSLGSGLPSWIDLLKRIATACLGADEARLVDTLRAEGFSLPAIAGMLRDRCRAPQEFAEVVRSELYRDFPRELVRADDPLPFVEYIHTKNDTLRAVAAMCAVPDPERESYRRNPLIHAVLNFNLDAVLRAYVRARYGRLLVRTLERPSKSPDRKKVGVYHVHGFLRFDAKARQPDKEAFDKLVLTEHEYFDFFNNPTGFFNYTFLYLLREQQCLFIGLSMQDDNIRRLLHYIARERVQGYLEEGEDIKTAREKACRHFAILRRYASPLVTETVERSLQGLGVTALWIDEYAEISKRLGQVYMANGGDWSLVY